MAVRKITNNLWKIPNRMRVKFIVCYFKQSNVRWDCVFNFKILNLLSTE